MATIPNQLFSENPRVQGIIERVTFQSPDTGFCVLKVRTADGSLVTVVGSLPEVTAGAAVDASGRWVQDPKFGRQLQADSLQLSRPATLDGIRRYLGSGLVPGIGPAFAERLVEAFGDAVFDIIENEPRRLREVPGIGPGRLKKILDSWSDQKVLREIMVFLQGHGIATGLATRIFKRYGADSIAVVEADPYRLVDDMHGVGFLGADRIAHRLGMAPDSPVRLRAGVEHVMGEMSRQGHTVAPEQEVRDQAVELLGTDEASVAQALAQALKDRLLVPAGEEGLVALPALHRAEKELASDLRRLASTQAGHRVQDADRAVDWVQEQTGLELADGQRRAVLQALEHPLLVITGGPGVGKTTLVNSILRILRAKKNKVVACAPTGRAAKRLSESTGLEAKTIHRLLDFNPGTGNFKHDRTCPLEGDVFVVDEFSMVDTVLAWQLVRALPDHAALLLVGDVDQLPSVGPGRVLADLIESGAVPVARLDTVFRQAARSAIVANAHRINAGELPVGPAGSRDEEVEDFYFIERDDPEAMVALITDLVARRLPRRLGVDPLGDIQVLTPMKRGVLGTGNLNAVLQGELNPHGAEVQRMGMAWRAGDKVMQTVNDYDKDVFNGDIGLIEVVDAKAEELVVRFDGRLVSYGLDELDSLMHSYAVSIHKSQGSEFPVVVIPLHTQHYMLLQRNLLYTGVTRGRRLVVLVGSKKAVGMAVGRQDSRRRLTGLPHYLGGGTG